MKLWKRLLLIGGGIGISLSAPFLILQVITAIIYNSPKPPEDFQYQDSYFVIYHFTWMHYLAAATVTFVLYVLAVLGVRRLIRSVRER